MSSVGVSRRRSGLVEGGGSASSSATARQSYYHCYNCDRMVTIIAAGRLVCSNCHGVVFEELGTPPPPPPPPPPLRSRNSYDYFFSPFRTAGFESDSDSDSDLELSCPLPPPPPPFFTTNTDFSYSDSDFNFSNPLPPPPPSPPPPPPTSSRTAFAVSGLEIDFSEQLPDIDNHFSIPPAPPSPPSSRAMISGLEIDFSVELFDRDNYFPPPPPPPPPLPTIFPDRRVHRLPPPTILPPNLPSHRLPPPPPRPGWMSNPTSSTIRGFDITDPLPPPPPPLPPTSLNMWDVFPWEPVLQSTTMSAISTMMEVKDEEEMLLDTKITEEMMLDWECSQCAVCIDNIEVNQVVMQMPCKHMYHSDCILPWLESHKTCPVCRYRLN